MPSLGLPIYGQKTALETRRWKSLDELEARTAAEPGEFPEGAAETPEGLSRRGFLQVLGASVALAGLQACKPPREKLVPYVRAPAAVTPSVPVAYATAASEEGYAVGLVVQAHEGRPVKIEGNRLHPASLGGSDAIRQALVLELYDPARLRGFTREGRALAWSALLQEIAALGREHDKDGGTRLRFLVAPTSSPTLGDLRRRVLERFPRARFDTWSATGEGAQRAGAAIAFGRPLDATYDVAKADVILSLDSDFLAVEGEHLRHAREFASRREGDRMNRLYVAEPRFSVTGGMADHRLRMRGLEVAAFARAVAAELAGAGLAGLGPLGAHGEGERVKVARAIAKDLAGARGRSLVLAGARQPPAVHALAAAMNEALGNVGTTVHWRAPVLLDPRAGADSLRELAGELAAGKIDTLVVTAWNALHTAPADLELRKAFGKVKNSMVLALREDETVRAASWRLAASHPLESWGDLRSRDGTVSIVQPLITPLYESATEIDLLAAFVGEGDRGAWRLVREGWRARSGAPPAPLPLAGAAAAANPVDTNRPRRPDPYDRTWDEWLAAGVLTESAGKPEQVAADLGAVGDALGKLPVPAGGIELGFAPDYKIWDGRLLENAWLQELPDPVTKLTWENAAHLSPATAKRLGLASGDLVELARGGRAVVAPVLIVPGHADDAVTVALGYGQQVAGPVGKGVGFDGYALRTSDAPWFAGGAELRKTGKRTDLAVTQGHFSMEGRAIALALDHEELGRAKAELDEHRGEAPTILEPVDYSDRTYKWGMAIDLSRCIGCGACTAACQAENNIPVVGKEQVLRSREMHWIRVDRYFEGPAEDPKSVTQPLACVHCEMAPCEYVCPVNATVHSDEGLNEMVYNRCVGTRYCSNNCPYKVRRFNFFDYHGDVAPTLQMLMNPDVTVRARGVMEKCTYCTQRIQRARIDARVGGKKIGPDEVVPACAQACPAEAITFGNLNDPRSRVSRKHGDARRYDLLHELGTRPRTAYLVKLRNPNPELA
ncbi:MAG TPA: TAT-variant-translocated molybdopterin oxidoreductase [Anaeromyxobacter sp.]|nr:TAT-variant-translocated molybdopterin oxidoreductase [Anaeromyxobacter sp.]